MKNKSGFTPTPIGYIPSENSQLVWGFTLIELIISITIFAVVIVAVYSTLYMGIKTWRRVEDKNSIETLRPALLRLETELKNSFFFSGIRFKGTSSEIVFPLILPGSDTYTITYTVNDDTYTGYKELIRKAKIFPEIVGKDTNEKLRQLIPLAKAIKFEYAYKTIGISDGFEWQDKWDPAHQNKLPSGVRVSLEMDGNNEIYSKVIFLPQGKLGK